jgi:hypothetical protein
LAGPETCTWHGPLIEARPGRGVAPKPQAVRAPQAVLAAARLARSGVREVVEVRLDDDERAALHAAAAAIRSRLG